MLPVHNIRVYERGKYHCTVDLLLDWFGLACFANKTKIFSCHMVDSKPVKQEVNGAVITSPSSMPWLGVITDVFGVNFANVKTA